MRYELTRDLETGNALIDSEHRELFRAVNDLMDACSQGKGREKIEETINFLSSYVGKHFKDEENLQMQTGYPGYAAHRQFHENYKRELNQAARALIADQGIAALGSLNQSIAVLVNHIRVEDKKVARHVKQ